MSYSRYYYIGRSARLCRCAFSLTSIIPFPRCAAKDRITAVDARVAETKNRRVYDKLMLEEGQATSTCCEFVVDFLHNSRFNLVARQIWQQIQAVEFAIYASFFPANESNFLLLNVDSSCIW